MMATERRPAVANTPRLRTSDGEHRDAAIRPRQATETGLVWRLVFVVVGFTVATIGWLLVLTVFLAFIGLPLFAIGLALMQAQER